MWSGTDWCWIGFFRVTMGAIRGASLVSPEKKAIYIVAKVCNDNTMDVAKIASM